MSKIWLMMSLSLLIFGLMVVGSLSLIFMLIVDGAGAFVHSPAIIFDNHHWGHAQDLDDPNEGSSHIFSGVLGPNSVCFRELSIGVLFLLCKLILVFILVLSI